MYHPIDISVEKVDVEEVSFFYTGPCLEEGPLPALFYFSSTGKASLSLDPYNQIAQFLQKKRIRLFSWNLPFHEEPFAPEKALAAFIEALQSKEDFFSSFFDTSQKILSYLFAKNLITPSLCVTSGLSRGSFFALHLASLFSFPFSIHFAPLLDLGAIEEISTHKEAFLLKRYTLTHLLKNLCTKELLFFIGNHDTRVKTNLCFSFFQNLVAAATEKNILSPKIELFSYPSVGRLGHGTPPEIFSKGADWICQKLKL